MSYLAHFLDETQPLVKPKFVAVEEDWLLLCKVYPEVGFRSFFLGHIVSKLASELRKNGITTYFQRTTARPELATIAGLLSAVQFTRNESLGDDGRGAGSPREATAKCEGESPGTASTPSGEDESGEGKSES